MKKKLKIGSLFAIFLLLMFPSISAVEFDLIEETYKEQVFKLLQTVDINELKEKAKDVIRDHFFYGLLMYILLLLAMFFYKITPGEFIPYFLMFIWVTLYNLGFLLGWFDLPGPP